jgi:hypothetical protein
MNELLELAAESLSEGGFSSRIREITAGVGDRSLKALMFEDGTVLGFMIVYDTPTELIAEWRADGDRIARCYRSALQAARQKAWNAYLVLIAREVADFGESLCLGQIEEDLEAMRKITKAGVTGAAGVRSALLPLMPFRAAPSLDPIDMREEIRLRTTELGDQVVQAFLSHAAESDIIQLLEERG